MQDRFSTETGVSSSASNSRPQQTHLGGASGYSSRNTYIRDTTDYDSELGHLLSPPSPPPSLEQVLAVEPSNSSSPRPIPTPSPNSSYQSLYDIECELLGPSSSHQQPPISNSNSRRYQSVYDNFAQALSGVPDSSHNSSRRQSAANQSTSRVSHGAYSRYPGVHYSARDNRWLARFTDLASRRRVSVGSYLTRSEAISALESYKASHPQTSANCPGAYRLPNGTWTAKYNIEGENVQVGTFRTPEEAARAVQRHRESRGLPPMVPRSRTG